MFQRCKVSKPVLNKIKIKIKLKHLFSKTIDLFGHISRKRVNGEMLDVWEKEVDDAEIDRNVGHHVEGGNAERRADAVDAAGTIVA